MSDYTDRNLDAYGRRKPTESPHAQRPFRPGLPWQARDGAPAALRRRGDARPVKVVNIGEPTQAPRGTPSAIDEQPRRPLADRSPREISDDVAAQLAASPFIDASGVAITVDGSEVTLDGTINSLIAIALAKALVSNVAGVGRVQIQLRVEQTPRSGETAAYAE
jgi:BON domain